MATGSYSCYTKGGRIEDKHGVEQVLDEYEDVLLTPYEIHNGRIKFSSNTDTFACEEQWRSFLRELSEHLYGEIKVVNQSNPPYGEPKTGIVIAEDGEIETQSV